MTENENDIERQTRLHRLDCQSLGTYAAWRKAIAVNFPDDPRNMRAAETLEKLAVDANNLSDEPPRLLRRADHRRTRWLVNRPVVLSERFRITLRSTKSLGDLR